MVRHSHLLKLGLGAVAIAVNVSLHAQMAQDPLLNRSGSVDPNVVFVLDDSGSMNATAIYQYGASAHGYGASGPNNDAQDSSRWTSDPPPSLYGRSPDVNLIYYDPRVTYKRQINADGTFKVAGTYTSTTSWNVYFYKPTSTTTYNVASVTVNSQGSGYPASGITASFPSPPIGGTQATATVNVTSVNRVLSVNITNQGSNYPSSGVTVAFSDPPSGGTRATGNVTLERYTTDYVGSFNNDTDKDFPDGSTCTVLFDAPPSGGVRATGTAVLASTRNEDPIGTFTITNPGSGYTSAPDVRVTCGGRTHTFSTNRARAYRITGVTITNQGSGYTSTPSVTFSNPQTGGTLATGTAVMGTTNVISSITVTNAGSGYTTQPPLTLNNTTPGTGVSYTVNYNSATTASSANTKWPGTGASPLNASSYFSVGTPPGYTPDAGSPLAVGANASIRYPNTASSSITQYPKFRDRTDCVSATTHCTWAEEAQNYANWKLYHSTRIRLAKTGIGIAFQPLSGNFRLGWGKINTLSSGSLDKGVRKYTSTVAGEFLTWLYGITPSGGTPNLQVARRVGTYFQRKDDNGPWADNPNGSGSISDTGTENVNHASCRRSYWMLMTDGYYNSATGFSQTDTDSTNGPLISTPTSYQYTPIGPYSDTRTSTKYESTLADVAMYYYLNDLRGNLPNNVRPVTGDEAYWQHLSFYGIGLGVVGTLDNTSAAVLQSLTGTSSSVPPRTRDWPKPKTDDPTAIDDMWHAALNSRGRMLNAKNADDLNEAVARMMSDISGREGTQAGVAVSTTSLTRGTKKYTPSYTPNTWNGNLTAYKLNSTTGVQESIAWQVETLVSTDPITGARTYTSLIPSASTRKIYVGNGGTGAVEFKYASMGTLTSQMNGTVNANLIDYLRGDATNEDTAAATSASAIYRPRTTKLADIVNSTPAFVKDSLDMAYEKLPPSTPGQSSYRAFVNQKRARTEGVIFVGANDGMLHGFRDGTYDADGNTLTPGGTEVFAYVPHAALPALHLLADKSYTHRYFVDGPIVEADAYLGGAWKNLVLGTMGGGAGVLASAGASPKSAVFAIDVTSLNTDVSGLNASSVMWEVHSGMTGFSELGHVLTDVQTGVSTNGTWVAIFGNGYESKSCKASLFVVNLQTGALLNEISTNVGACTAGNKNGLGGVRLVRNSEQQIIGAYAGDLRGNMWKFNLTAGAPTSWALDLGGAALYGAGSTRPITAQPTVLPLPMVGTTDPKPGYMVVFGTGRFYQTTDTTNVDQQSLFGIWDTAAFGATSYSSVPFTGTTTLTAQTIGTAQLANGNTYFAVSTNSVPYTGPSAKRGWYINFPNSGQRLVYPLDLLANRFAVADTIAPVNVNSDPCNTETSGVGYMYIVDALNGGGPTEAILDTNGDGNVDTSDLVVSGIQGKADGRNVSLLVTANELQTVYANVSGGDPGATQISLSCRLTNTCVVPAAGGLRRQWRQLFLR